MYNRTAGRKTVIYTPPSAPSGKRNRTAVIEQLLTVSDKKFCPEGFR